MVRGKYGRNVIMKKKSYCFGVLVVIGIWIFPCLVFADYQAGKNAFDRMDYQVAFKEFKALAEKNDASGQYGLGVMYDMGEGVPHNSKEAAKWYRLSAEQGNADAQNNLGAMYEAGEGIPYDSKQAVKWYRKAAEGHNFDAPNNLGAMYLTGVGVPRDNVRAYMWFDLAIRRGDRAAAKNMNFVKKKMTSDQIMEAQSLANRWMDIYLTRWKRLR
jgi:uncharacterized protein